jgi:hypothetical protein
MMGHRQVEQAALFYEFSLEKYIPDHLLRSIDRFVDLGEINRDLAPPNANPKALIRTGKPFVRIATYHYSELLRAFFQRNRRFVDRKTASRSLTDCRPDRS